MRGIWSWKGGGTAAGVAKAVWGRGAGQEKGETELMAEAFLEEIYKDAFAIELLRGCIDDLYCSNHVAAREKYNTAALIIESMIARLASAKDDNASTMEKVAVEIPENWKDPAFVTGKIKAELIPLLYDFMSHFTDIDIEDGKYLLRSTRSPFLQQRKHAWVNLKNKFN